MAAYYAGLHKRLKDNSVPIGDRVKLARFGWVSKQCFLPNKHQVLLDWVCFRLVNSEKDETSEVDEKSLWLFLHDALKSQEMLSIQREGKPICLRGNLCSALLSTLAKDDVSDIVIGCCGMILTNEKLRFVQNTKFESFVGLTVALVQKTTNALKENSGLDEYKQLTQVMGKALIKCSNLLPLQQNGKKAYGLMSELLILPCLNLHSLHSSHHNEMNAVSSAVRNLLFTRNMSEAYRTYLMSEEGDKQKKDGRVWADVVDKFMEYLQSKSEEAGLISGLPVFYSAFLTSFKPSSGLTFAMLQKMCTLINFKTDEQPSECSDDTWKRKITTLEALLKLASSHKCYGAMDEEAERTKKLNWFKAVVSSLLANKSLDSAWYGCLRVIFELDHNILATQLQEVWPCLLATNPNIPHDELDDDYYKPDPQDSFLKSVMETYTKLRQIDRLTKFLLSSILSKKEFSTSIQLPGSFFASFGIAIESLTPGSTVALWDIIMQDITTNHLPAVMNEMKQTSDDPPPKKKKRKSNSLLVSDINSNVFARFEVVSLVLHTFLVNSKMVDAAEVGQVKGQVLKLFDTMANDVLKPLLGKFSQDNQSLSFSTLLLCHGWGELHLILRQHTNLMEKLPLSMLDTPMKNGDVHYLHTYSSASDWLRVASTSDAQGNEKLCFLNHQLLWQQVRGLVLHGNLDEGCVKESLTKCLHQALDLGVERTKTNSKSWNGVISQVTCHNIYTALQRSLLDHYSTLFTFMDEEMHSTIASNLCQGDRTRTLCFLHSEVCVESRAMQNAVVKDVADRLQELSRTLEACKKDGGKEVHSKPKQKDMKRSEVINEPLSMNKTGIHLIMILEKLPLLHLSSSNQLQCMLGLVSLDTHTVPLIWTSSSSGRQGSCDFVRLSTAIRKLLTDILKGVQHGDEVLRNKELKRWFFDLLFELGNVLCQEDSRLSTMQGNKEDLVRYKDELKSYNEASEGLMLMWLKKSTWAGNAVTDFKEYLKSFHPHLVKCLQKLKSSKNPASLPGVTTVLSIGVTLQNQCALACKHKTPGTESKELLALASEVRSTIFLLLGQTLASTSKHDSDHQLTSILRSAKTLLVSLESTQKTNRLRMEEEKNSSSTGVNDESDPYGTHSPHFTTCYERALSTCFEGLKGCLYRRFVMESCLEYLAAHCNIIRNTRQSKTVWSQLHTHVSHVHSSDIQRFEALLTITLGAMETDDLRSQLLEMLSNLVIPLEVQTSGCTSMNVIGVLKAWQLIPTATLSDESYSVVMEIVPKVLKQCEMLLHGTVQIQPLEGTLIAEILSTAAKFISQGKDLLSAEHAIPTMHLCLMVPWDRIQASDYPSCFAAIFRILNSLLMCYPGSVIKAVSAYISCVNHLLSALMERCSLQTDDQTMRVTDEQLVTCAEQMQRLLSLIASLKGDISQYGIYLIADYINGLQKTTLLSQVKTPLVDGVYKIVDVCDEKTLSLLNVTLPISLKEIFRSFYADYKKHYKFTGHV